MCIRDRYLVETDKKRNAEVSVFKMYKLFIQREKFIYQTLNMFSPLHIGAEGGSEIYQGLAWCPSSANFDMVLARMRDQQNFSGLNY